jgi:hypothetical protein
MKKLNRRTFLTLAGASSAAAAAGIGMPSSGILTGQAGARTLTFRAVVGLPSELLPAYASYVVEGHVNLANRTGIITKALYAGGPQGMSTIALPGQSRLLRVTAAEDLGGTYRITGVIDDRSQLQPGEDSTFSILIDPAQRIARTTLSGSELVMQLEG